MPTFNTSPAGVMVPSPVSRASSSGGVDPVMLAALGHVEKTLVQRSVRRAGSICGSRASRGSCASRIAGLHSDKAAGKKEAEESILPYVPKAYELYVLAALPLIPFLLLLLFLGPLLLEE